MHKKDQNVESTQPNASHQFKVLVYRNEHQQIRYKFLQSYIGRYSLKDFLNKVNTDEIQGEYSHQEFLQFMNELYSILKATGWNEIDKLFKQYFHVDCTGYQDHHFLSPCTISINSVQFNLNTVKQAQTEFAQYKNSESYPNFIFLSGDNDEETQIIENEFLNSSNDGEDYCAFEHPWKALIFRQSNAGYLLSSNHSVTLGYSL